MKKRSPSKNTSGPDILEENDANNNKDEKKDEEKVEPKQAEKSSSEIKLSDLLAAFDGVLEMKGRMMVMTTNHLEKLDPALIRPGRVDLSLEFKRCTKSAIGEFFETFFPENHLDMNKVEDFVWTPAEVAQICINHQDDVELAIEKIYERKTVPKEGAHDDFDKKDDETLSESGSDFTDSGASDVSSSSLNDLKLKKRSSILMR